MSTLIFWVIFIAYWVVAVKHIPSYFRKYDEFNKREWPSIYSKEKSHRESAGWAIFLAAFWPFIDAWTWMHTYVLNSVTSEERKQAEYDKAEKIVTEYKKQQEKRDCDDFDRKLNS